MDGSGIANEAPAPDFVGAPKLSNLRPGSWEILKLGNNNRVKTSDFSQYEHLAYLNELTKVNSQLAAVLGNDYMVSPDVIIYRNLCNDEEINTPIHRYMAAFL